MAGVTNIIFDLGKVLIDFDHRIATAKLAPLSRMPAEEIYSLFFDSKLTKQFEEGQIEPGEFYGKVKRILKLKLRYEQFVPIWNQIFFLSEDNREVYALARKLKESYTVSMLSNINALHFAYIKEHFPIFDAFHHVFTSYELGHMKPDPRIYSIVLKQLNVKPGEVFYTDDRAELIEKARTMGIRAYQYTGVAQLKKDLSHCGITLPDSDTAPVSTPV
jgi:glucose-1-phosphatase